MPRLVDPTPRTTLASLKHISLVEQAVNRYTPRVWALTVRQLLPWLRRTLAAVRPQVESLVLERAYEAETAYLQALLEGHRRNVEPPPGLGQLVPEIAEQVALQSGFLATDPRRDRILRHTTRILQDDLSSYWAGLTEPRTLAKRIVDLRSQGVSYHEMSRQIANQYQTEVYRAERLIRSSYNSSANYAHFQDLVDLYDELRWLTARDNRVRAGGGKGAFDHRHADGQTVKVGEPFIVSGEQLLYPGDRSRGASAGNIVNCRCTVVGMK